MAAITDKITSARDTTNPITTTVASARSISGTSLSCVALDGWPTNTAVHFITYKKTTAGLIDKTTQCDWKGIVSGTTIGTLTLKNGTDAGNDVGDFVQMGPTAAWEQDLADGITTSLNQDGTLKNSSVATATIADSAVTTAKVANGAITASKLATGALAAYVATLESTASASYVDLATTTDSVTVTIGANGLCLVSLYCGRYNNTNSGQALMSFVASGANTIVASDTYCIGEVNSGNFQFNGGAVHLLTGLTAGSTTFKAKYRAQTAGTAFFINRRISVIPL